MSEQHLEGIRGSADVSPSRAFSPELKYNSPGQRPQPRTEALVTRPSCAKTRSPLPSVRKIDAALPTKYGAARYREIRS